MAHPKVSVLMTTYNGAAFIRDSVNSVLRQSFRDFELLVVDDCSTDETASILATYADPRLRLVRPAQNVGIVGARNLGFSECSGEYIAALDHDDLSETDRIAVQSAFLNTHPSVALVGSRVEVFGENWGMPGHYADKTTPMLIRWLLHVINPLVYSSIMFRRDAVRQIGYYMQPEFQYSDDFDLYHRMLLVGDIAYIDCVLTRYRTHASNTTHSKSGEMSANAVAILAKSYKRLPLGCPDRAASLIWHHLGIQSAPTSVETLAQLGRTLDELLSGFLSEYQPAAADQLLIEETTGRMWWKLVMGTARRGIPDAIRQAHTSPLLSGAFQPSWTDLAGAATVGWLRSISQKLGSQEKSPS